ncbi:hypothetical protein AVEN_89136-1 [Araneus ventricosus]|uniref:Uncharacterized protein n=1 Tax=Araneus ventricosus TaxID=182803 RepID=A0A4Y2B481_ARAVE|nr:hypothetical protein AVEN_89136-1 [Araneus ventricosus]
MWAVAWMCHTQRHDGPESRKVAHIPCSNRSSSNCSGLSLYYGLHTFVFYSRVLCIQISWKIYFLPSHMMVHLMSTMSMRGRMKFHLAAYPHIHQKCFSVNVWAGIGSDHRTGLQLQPKCINRGKQHTFAGCVTKLAGKCSKGHPAAYIILA